MAINKALVQQIQREAARSGTEICGALVRSPDTTLIALPVTNESRAPESSYLIPATRVLELERAYDLVGFYHSHPRGSTQPSATDLELAIPGYIYLIVTHADARVWRLRADRSGFDELEIRDDD